MSSDYNYDTDAQFFPFFVLTITSLVTFPLSYTLLRSPTDYTSLGKGSQITSSYQPHNVDVIDTQRAKEKRKELRLKRILTAATGWLVMAYMVYLMIVTARTVPKIWNPYDILQVSMSAGEKDINRRYRKLSITMHPDKRVPNSALNETVDSVNNEWVEIVKAYKSLTDEEIRRNYIEYGNPDGKQSTSFGIALPQFLVAEGSGKYVLLLYGVLLGIGLPWLVGKWWYGAKKETKERVLVTSIGNMFQGYKERMDSGDVIGAIASATEFQDILGGAKADAGLGGLEKELQSPKDSEFGMPGKDSDKLGEIEDPVRRKSVALLWAYLLRLQLDDKTLEAEKYELPPTAAKMADAFVSIAHAHGFTAPVMVSYKLSQSLIQAIPPTANRMPLLQLPHFTPSIVKSIEKTSPKVGHMTVQAFMSLPPEQRQTVAQAAGLSRDRMRTAETIATQLPYLRVEKAFFKVQGEKYIIPSSLVQYVVKARFIPPGTMNVPPASEKDLLDIDPADGDIKAQKIEAEEHPVPLVYAPFFARDRAPKWHLFLADNRQGKIAVPAFTFSMFDKQPFDSEGKPTFAVVTLKMQFQAPPQAGEYRFHMHLICDSYLGFDHTQEANLVVDEPGKAEEVDSSDEISEPDEGKFADPSNTCDLQTASTNDRMQIPLLARWQLSRASPPPTRVIQNPNERGSRLSHWMKRVITSRIRMKTKSPRVRPTPTPIRMRSSMSVRYSLHHQGYSVRGIVRLV